MEAPTEALVAERLAAAGVRFTAARRAVLAELLRSGGPRSAAELRRRLRRVPLSSLYRSLTVLEGAGVLTPHLGARGVIRYEPAEWLAGHHHHLVCTRCGAVEDLAMTAAEEARLDRLVGSVAAREGLAPGAHTLELEWRCPRCAA